MPEVTPLLDAVHTNLQDQDRPVVISFLTAPKKGNLSTLIHHCSKGSLCLQLCSSLCKEMPGSRGGDTFLTKKVFVSLLGSLAQPGRAGAKASYDCFDFFGAEMNGLK